MERRAGSNQVGVASWPSNPGLQALRGLCKVHAEAFRKACHGFALLSLWPKLLADGTVPIDGSKFAVVGHIRVRYISSPLFTELPPTRKI